MRVHTYRNVLVLEDFSDLCANTFKQATLPFDVVHVNVERLRNPRFRYTPFDDLEDHPMLLDDRQAVDPFIIGEPLVIRGDEANHVRFGKHPSGHRCEGGHPAKGTFPFRYDRGQRPAVLQVQSLGSTRRFVCI